MRTDQRSSITPLPNYPSEDSRKFKANLMVSSAARHSGSYDLELLDRILQAVRLGRDPLIALITELLTTKLETDVERHVELAMRLTKSGLITPIVTPLGS